jgi:hypothetical protein
VVRSSLTGLVLFCGLTQDYVPSTTLRAGSGLIYVALRALVFVANKKGAMADGRGTPLTCVIVIFVFRAKGEGHDCAMGQLLAPSF